MLRFHMKKKCINFGSYLDKQRMHFNGMRKINCTEKRYIRAMLIAMFDRHVENT